MLQSIHSKWSHILQEVLEKLQGECDARDIEKFSAEEMVELLQDGEEVSWILGQIGAAPGDSIASLLDQLAVEYTSVPTSDNFQNSISSQVGEVRKSIEENSPGFDPSSIDVHDLKDMLPEGVDLDQVKNMLSSPQGALLADFAAFCQERGVELDDGEAMGEEIKLLQKEWLDTSRPTLGGKKPSDEMDRESLFPNKVETFRREDPKVGRNDPCTCGSGQKYKKCCGNG